MRQKKETSFFEVYAHEYDLLTNAAQRERHHATEVAAIIERFKPEFVLDAGCGTGLTSMLFARQGVPTVGLDRSRSMLALARKKYDKFDLPLTFRYGRFERMPKVFHNKFDLIVCLANSIVGVETLNNLTKSLKNFHSALKMSGTLILQMLNYGSMKEGALYPIRATEANGIVYERFSERRGRSLLLYVTRADFRQQPPQFEVFRHQFDNFTDREMSSALKRAGFRKLYRYADLLFTKRFTKSARDLIIVTRKPAE